MLVKTQEPNFWEQQDAQTSISQLAEKKQFLSKWEQIIEKQEDVKAVLEIIETEETEEFITEATTYIGELTQLLDTFDLYHLLSGKHDKSSAIISINAGAGGTEARDWASMLCRMYMRWAEEANYKAKILDILKEDGGIKYVAISIEGSYVYGYAKQETGVHRLVRISPFDSNKRRHTSFAAVEVLPDMEETSEDIEIATSDLRIDTFRASGAGGQHVNTTDSAVRILHIPTGITVQCQNERSQHSNKATAMKLLKATLAAEEEKAKQEEKNKVNAEKKEIAWGSQVRSYIMQPYQMVKDHRSNIEIGDVQAVLDGKLSELLEKNLRFLSNTT